MNPRKKKVNGRGKRSQFSNAFRIRIATEYLNSEKSLRDVGNQFGVTHAVVANCVRFYERELKMQAINANTESPDPDQGGDNDEVARLRAQLADALLRLDASETMIDAAEEELGVSIRKKSGSRQSNE